MNVARMLTDTVTIAHQTSVSESGDPVFGSQSTFLGRVEHVSKLVAGPDGTQMTADHVIATQAIVVQTDRLWLPGDDTSDNNAARRPITIRKATTFDGSTTLYEVYL